MELLQIGIRQINHDDKSFIINSLVKHHIDNIDYKLDIDKELLKKLNKYPAYTHEKNMTYASMTALIEKWLEKKYTLVACDLTYPDENLGYVIFDPVKRYLYFCYVKFDFRKEKIGSRLMLAAFESFDKPILCPFKTPALKHLKDKWNIEYDSLLLREVI
jgi:hypothetical protein